MVVGELVERRPRVATFGDRADRVGGHQAHTLVDGVGHERVGVEEPALVIAQGEEGQGVAAVGRDEAAGLLLGFGWARVEAGGDDRTEQGPTGGGHQSERGGEEGWHQEAVDPFGQVDGGHADHALGHGLERRPERRTGAATAEGLGGHNPGHHGRHRAQHDHADAAAGGAHIGPGGEMRPLGQ